MNRMISGVVVYEPDRRAFSMALNLAAALVLAALMACDSLTEPTIDAPESPPERLTLVAEGAVPLVQEQPFYAPLALDVGVRLDVGAYSGKWWPIGQAKVDSIALVSTGNTVWLLVSLGGIGIDRKPDGSTAELKIVGGIQVSDSEAIRFGPPQILMHLIRWECEKACANVEPITRFHQANVSATSLNVHMTAGLPEIRTTGGGLTADIVMAYPMRVRDVGSAQLVSGQFTMFVGGSPRVQYQVYPLDLRTLAP